MHQKTTVAFVRHGQAVLNVEDIALGTMESPLSPLGLTQAEERARMLSPLNPSFLYASEIGRAKETAAIIGREIGLSVLTDPLLNERFVGSEIQGKPNSEVRTLLAKETERLCGLSFSEQLHFRFECAPEAETAGEAIARLDAFLRKMAERHPGKTVVAVTHAALLGPFLVRAGLFAWQGPFASDQIGNAALFLVDTDGEEHALRI